MKFFGPHRPERVLLRRNTLYVVREETDKDPRQPPDQIVYGQKFGRKLVKPLRIEKNRNGQKRSRSSTMLKN